MTTIAYKDGIIAYDSQLTSGDGSTITDDNYNKCVVVDSVRFFMSGSACDYSAFIDAYFNDNADKYINVSALVVENNRVYSSSTTEKNKLWKLDIYDMVYAIGSGGDHALTAMDCGLDAKSALRMAIKLDTSSGGKIRVFKVY